MFGKAIWDKLTECIFENFEITRVKLMSGLLRNSGQLMVQCRLQSIVWLNQKLLNNYIQLIKKD